MPFEARDLTLRGVLSVEGTDAPYPVVKLHFYEQLESSGRDGTFFDLRNAVPYAAGFALPYASTKTQRDRDLGLRGTAKLSLPAARGSRGKAAKARMLAQAISIVRFEVEPANQEDPGLHEDQRIPGMAEAEVQVRTRRWQLANGSAGVALDVVSMRPLYILEQR